MLYMYCFIVLKVLLLNEGLNGVNRQMAKKITDRQKQNLFTVNRQMSESKLAIKFLRYP